MQKPQDIIYVGDPMCSWCWGIAEVMSQVQQLAAQNGVNFTIMVGGLRVGGGQAWDDEFKTFLQHHWQQVHERSGQPFGYKLFDLPEFNYDTEPACRAVVAAKNLCEPQNLANDIVLKFFVAIQRKFYVDSQDPKQVDFYETICSDLGISFSDFSKLFNAPEIAAQTTAEFNITRNWGVSGYPTLLLSDGAQLQLISSGFQSADTLLSRLEPLILTKA